MSTVRGKFVGGKVEFETPPDWPDGTDVRVDTSDANEYVGVGMREEVEAPDPADRSQRDVQDKLRAVEDACRGEKNLMHPVLDAVKAYCTLGEVCDVFRKVWGAYREKGTF